MSQTHGDSLPSDLLTSFQVSAAIVGLAIGPFLFLFLSYYISRPSCIFWGMLVTIGMCSWSAASTSPNAYTSFVISRWLSGTFASVGTAIGAGVIFDIFYLHQRGRAYACYGVGLLMGPLLGPTFSGFIVGTTTWPVQFWWTVGVEGLVAVLVFLFLKETRYPRGEGSVAPVSPNTQGPPRSFISDRLDTFFPGHQVLHPAIHRNSPMDTLLIAASPVTILAGTFLMLSFGWYVAVNTLLGVFLQTPVEAGGYGFTPIRNALFFFALWLGLGLSYLYATLTNDRVPLWMCRHRSGIWKPEYRLFPLLVVPAILYPIALGIFGAALQYHLHYLVLALGTFILAFAEYTTVPVMNNYVAESFGNQYAAELFTIMNCERLILGIVVPFFITPWQESVGPGWVFGTQAFLSLVAFSLAFLLAWKGPAIRKLNLITGLQTSETVELKLYQNDTSSSDTEKEA